jgi:PmbA protein
MDLLTKLLKECEQAEVLTLENEKTLVAYEANQLKTSTITETAGTAVRVIRKGRLGFSASTDETAVDRLAVNALESAAFGDQAVFNFPSSKPASPVRTYDPKLASLSIQTMAHMGAEIVDLIKQAEPAALCNLNLERSQVSVTIRNQTGLDISYQTSPLSISLEVDKVEGDDILMLYDQFATTLWDEDYLEFVHRMVTRLEQARTITTLKPGPMPVLFSPSGTLALALPLQRGLNGREVLKGASPMKGRIGEQFFDQKISLIDDGTLDGRFASSGYDDEGVPRQRTVLVDQGILKGFIYDLKNAALNATTSTGNARRGLFNPPEPAFSNYIIQPGATPLKAMLAGIEHGILVNDLLGLGQGNIISGAFSNPIGLAFKIEKGEIVGRVKDLSIAGNVYDLLKDVAAVSRETYPAYTFLFAPYILLPQMNVAGKA